MFALAKKLNCGLRRYYYQNICGDIRYNTFMDGCCCLRKGHRGDHHHHTRLVNEHTGICEDVCVGTWVQKPKTIGNKPYVVEEKRLNTKNLSIIILVTMLLTPLILFYPIMMVVESLSFYCTEEKK